MPAMVNHSWAKVLGFRLAQLPIKQEDKGSMNDTSLIAIYLSEDAIFVEVFGIIAVALVRKRKILGRTKLSVGYFACGVKQLNLALTMD